jgi:hypothetical protein
MYEASQEPRGAKSGTTRGTKVRAKIVQCTHGSQRRSIPENLATMIYVATGGIAYPGYMMMNCGKFKLIIS